MLINPCGTYTYLCLIPMFSTTTCLVQVNAKEEAESNERIQRRKCGLGLCYGQIIQVCCDS